MAKYSKKMVDKICSLISKDSYTVVEICNIVGIHKDTYYHWLETKNDFSDAIKIAKEEYTKTVLEECNKSLRKLITGYTVQEKKVITVDSGKKNPNGTPIPKIKEQTIIDKHIQPSLGAIIHFQTNNDPENWKNKQSTEVTGKDGKPLIPEPITIEIIDNREKVDAKDSD